MTPPSPLLERFLRYVRIDTTSDPESSSAPSSERQLVLARLLVEELLALGLSDARIGEGGVVYASLPATPGCETRPSVGFIAHMDTSPDAKGSDVKPQVIRYEGGDVLLNAEGGIVFSAERFPEIRRYRGEDVIFTDGTTLLGADDKAGIAALMEMLSRLTADPGIPHARIAVAFTPDEEIGRGTENFRFKEFGADYAYTFDGGERGGLESENFNAATAVVTFTGVGVHPGSSKGKMVNALRLAAKFVANLPEAFAPETTEGHVGFLHPNSIEGDVTRCRVRILIREHDAKRFEKLKNMLLTTAIETAMRNPIPVPPPKVEIRESYRNMRPLLEKTPKVLEVARDAIRAVGLEPREEPIRGGTDGARLTFMGLPTPNLFTGGMNYHGVFECLPVRSLELAAETALEVAKRSAEVTSLS